MMPNPRLPATGFTYAVAWERKICSKSSAPVYRFVSGKYGRNRSFSDSNEWSRHLSKNPGSLNHPLTVARRRDRKRTRLNSSHVASSYAVFWLKKKQLVFVVFPISRDTVEGP